MNQVIGLTGLQVEINHHDQDQKGYYFKMTNAQFSYDNVQDYVKRTKTITDGSQGSGKTFQKDAIAHSTLKCDTQST